MWSFKINSATQGNKEIIFNFTVSKDKVKVADDTVIMSADLLWRCPSDGRSKYIKEYLTMKCQKFMVVEDVKTEFSDILNVDIPLDAVKYETQAEIDAKIQAQQIKEGTV